jgi:hypothetical protein
MILFVQGFVLEFIFEPNDYFTNPILTKEYFIRFSVDEENPLGYEGPDIVKCAGYVISLCCFIIAASSNFHCRLRKLKSLHS